MIYKVNRKEVQSVAEYQKISNEVGRIDKFRALARICPHSIYLSTSGLLNFIISKTDKHEFSSIWKCISCSNDGINHIGCVMKRDVYPQKMHLCSNNISGISFYVLKISVVYQEKIYHRCYCMGISLVER